MTTTQPSGRHRRRTRIVLPVTAAGIAAAVAVAVMTSSAGAATAVPTPTVGPATGSPSLATLQKRIAGALVGDDTAGRTTEKSSPSSGTNTSNVEPMIIGGSETTLGTAPWMAQLWYHDDRNTTDTSDDVDFFCGGAVVAPTKILTAARCLRNDNRDYDWQAHGAVVTGTDRLPTTDSTDSTGTTDLHGGQATAVLRQWWQPGYDPVDREVGKNESDLGLLTLSVPVKATPIRMVGHGDTGSYATGTQAKFYGWGRTSSTSQDISRTLRTATLTLQSDTTCSGAYDTAFVAGKMVCAGTQSGSDTGTSAICDGDFGGPLVVGGRIVGVASWGHFNGCAVQGKYSVFTKMSAYAGSAYRQIDDTNLSTFNNKPDGKADIFVRDSSTRTGYEKDSSGSSFGARASWGNWSGANLVLQSDLNRDGYQDLIYRAGSTGDVYWKHFVLNSARTGGSWASTKISTGWKTCTRIIAPGDVTGDYLPDILSVDSGGTLWIYPGKGNGTFGSRFSARTGWNQYNSVRGHGDFTGDGRADLLARQSSTGDLYLYKGTGKTGSEAFSSRIKVRSAWTGYNAFDAVGDISGDGLADFLARTPGGTLYLYKGTAKATSEIFATRVSVGTGFQQYDIWG